ncbi:hypothetical protein [Kushneria aurantia]|uniref:Uncharacterized protein n=1 Tax=Kushneria aurantia TaxID=504092 RepID=A0ABV6FYF6_9GAMM|nr:hypothetical protein [Kushneria aurantia]
MATLIWIASLIALLGGYGLKRGFSRDISLSLILVAAGIISAALIIINTTASLSVASVVIAATFGLCLIEGRREIRSPARGRATHSRAHPLSSTLHTPWQGRIRARRAPRHGATPRRRAHRSR